MRKLFLVAVVFLAVGCKESGTRPEPAFIETVLNVLN